MSPDTKEYSRILRSMGKEDKYSRTVTNILEAILKVNLTGKVSITGQRMSATSSEISWKGNEVTEVNGLVQMVTDMQAATKMT